MARQSAMRKQRALPAPCLLSVSGWEGRDGDRYEDFFVFILFAHFAFPRAA